MDASALKVGTIYFLVGYSDPKCHVPKIETLEYSGTRLVQDSAGRTHNRHVFVDPHEQHQKIAKRALGIHDPHIKMSTAPIEIFTDEFGLREILDLEHLIDWLSKFEARKNANK